MIIPFKSLIKHPKDWNIPISSSINYRLTQYFESFNAGLLSPKHTASM